MTNMRRGFTMIELIFVIVIIGILAAVAIPKLASTAENAKKSVITSFLGTLNRTVGPAMWADVALAGGDVNALPVAAYTDLPTGVTLAAGTTWGTCAAATPAIPGVPGIPEVLAPDGITVISPAVPAIPEVPGTTGYVKVADITTAALPVAEEIFCLNGTSTQAPKFAFDVNGAQTLVNN